MYAAVDVWKMSDSLLDHQNIEGKINSIYETLIESLHDEMDSRLDYKEFTPNTNKRKRRNSKPYWNTELQNLELRNIFKDKRRQFDKRLRQEE